MRVSERLLLLQASGGYSASSDCSAAKLIDGPVVLWAKTGNKLHNASRLCPPQAPSTPCRF